MEVTKEQLYNMDLHEMITVSRPDGAGFKIIRVIGGWIYIFHFASSESRELEVFENHVFVPEK